MQNHNLFDVLRNIANQYPKDMMDEQIRDISRISFNTRRCLGCSQA